MFNPSRDQVREFFFQTWTKAEAGQALSDLERLAYTHIAEHPEYHAVLRQPERYRAHAWPPELGETNPFLHLSLHLSISEQVSIDQPPGIRAALQRLQRRLGETHAAQHAVMDCLAEMLWRAQRDNLPPDAAAYLFCLEQKCLG